ncbi:NADH-cytochrome b5 reductase-like [Ylistrum balloti]|uniref:NADH-cytochrome b5 reductase-like n=1 Tax=Ylistrum balloti TaxID=509963 RepID=UPI002905E0DB|nr:NADH-cytochrome b5 reductase-like [Ylistrum balloti]
MNNTEELDVSSKCQAIVSNGCARLTEDAILLISKNDDESYDNDFLPKPQEKSLECNILQKPNGKTLANNLFPKHLEKNLQDDSLLQPPGKPPDGDLLLQPPGKPPDGDLLLQPPGKPPDGDLLLQPPGKPPDGDLLLQPPGKPPDGDLLLQPSEKPPDGDLLLQPPGKPPDGDLLLQPSEKILVSDLGQLLESSLKGDHLPQPLEKPFDSDHLPQPLEKPIDSDHFPQSLEKPLDSDHLPQPPEKPLDSDCCGTGCVPCVFDIYTQEMKIWERECCRIRQKHKFGDYNAQDENVRFLAEAEYHQFTLESISRVTKDTQIYRFHLPMGRSLGLKLGQHVILRGVVDGDVVTRQYTPVSDVKVTDYFELLIKLYENGKMSQFIRAWKPGIKVDLRGPFGEYSYTPNQHARLMMLAAGSGIAPMAQIIQGILNNEEDDTRIQLLYACRTYNDILMKSQLDEWTEFWNFSVLYVLSQEPTRAKNNYRYSDKVQLGRLDKDLLANELRTPVLSSTRILISGTKSFDKDMLKYCKILGIQDCDIHKF